MLDRYAEASGRDLSQIDFYVAFGYWKLACIVEGVYARYVSGAMGSTDPPASRASPMQVERCADAAAEAVGRWDDEAAAGPRCTRWSSSPSSTAPVLVIVAQGLDRRRASGPTRRPTSSPPSSTCARSPASTPTRCSTSGPAGRSCAWWTGVNTRVTWAEIELAGSGTGPGNDVLLLVGAEPDHSWRASPSRWSTWPSSSAARLVIGLGAYPAPVPHTRPALVAASTARPGPRRGPRAGQRRGARRRAGAIERRAALRGLPAIGLWAQVPHYAAAMPYPAASLVLLETANRIGGLRLPTGDLAAQAVASRARIDELIAQNPEHLAMLRQLEQQVDEQPSTMTPTSGEELAAELERFLRDQT